MNQITAIVSIQLGSNIINKEILFQPYDIQRGFSARLSFPELKPNYSIEYGPHTESKKVNGISNFMTKIDNIEDKKLKGSIYKSLYWFNEAHSESSKPAKFLKLFIAIESLSKKKSKKQIVIECGKEIEKNIPVSTLDSIAEKLDQIHNISNSKEIFHLNKVARLRALIAHHGRSPKISFYEIEFLQFIYEDILNNTLGEVNVKTKKYLENEEFYMNLKELTK